MQLDRDDPEFRPVTIRISTQDELDQLLAILWAVAENKINHLPSVIAAAKNLSSALNMLLVD